MPALLFGSMSTLIDTSEIQREAFNDAFAAHDLDWHWDLAEYAALLRRSGGRRRIADYAVSRGEVVDAAAVHATKTTLFQQKLAVATTPPRPGVLDTVRAAQKAGVLLGIVTTTSPQNVAALLAALDGTLAPEDFAVIVDLTDVEAAKPDKSAYVVALSRLGEDSASCVAVEDNLGGLQSATAAGVATIAFPNANTSSQDLVSTIRVETLSFRDVRALLSR